ncbi:MAG: aminotransferase class V-fold PLP-dependent enzyme, partial [Bacteroidota bacterium]
MPDRRHFLRRLGAGALGVTALGAGVPELGEPRPAWPPPAGTSADPYWQLVRRQYPLTFERTYLNCGGIGPASYAALDAHRETERSLQEVASTGHKEIGKARQTVAAFFGIEPAELAFMRNATEGNSMVAMGLRLSPGDEVIIETRAHPGGLVPWLARQRRDGIVVKAFTPSNQSIQENLDRIDALRTPRTKAVQVSHVTAPTGIKMPAREVAEWAHQYGIWAHVDGAQTAGMLPVALHEIDCDSYAACGHKWMGGPHGTGVLYVKQDRQDDLTSTEIGAYTGTFTIPGSAGGGEYVIDSTAVRYEAGTRNAALIVGLAAAVDFLTSIGMERVGTHGRDLARQLAAGLAEMPGVDVLTPRDEALAA